MPTLGAVCGLKCCRLVRVRALVSVFCLAGIQTSLIALRFLVLGVFSADMRAGLHAAGRRATVTDRQTHAPFGAPMFRAVGGAGGSTAHILGLVAGPHRLVTTPVFGLWCRAGARDPNPALGAEGRLGPRTFPRRPAGSGRPVTQVVQRTGRCGLLLLRGRFCWGTIGPHVVFDEYWVQSWQSKTCQGHATNS